MLFMVFLFCVFSDWMESGMESDVSENLETDEMYLMLQADMVSRHVHIYITGVTGDGVGVVLIEMFHFL